jgi:predicted DNA-binding protein (UPF0251 family)
LLGSNHQKVQVDRKVLIDVVLSSEKEVDTALEEQRALNAHGDTVEEVRILLVV